MAESEVIKPGEITKPVCVWASATTLRIGFYQAQPVSDTLSFFYKKFGSVFGKEITIPASEALGPEISIKPPTSVESEYYEYDIVKLKPSTQYVIKVKSGDGRFITRASKISTISADEEKTRNIDMTNFVGGLVKLGDFDGMVTNFEPPTGLFHVRILQVDDVRISKQLVRFSSEYSDTGLPVHTYTLSQLKFGRFGGEVRGSKIVSEGELKWIVARAVQMEEQSEAVARYDAREKLLQITAERHQLQLEQRSEMQISALAATKQRWFATSCALAMVMLLLAGYFWWHNRVEAATCKMQITAADLRIYNLEAALETLDLYRTSLELDTSWRLSQGDGDTPPSSTNDRTQGSSLDLEQLAMLQANRGRKNTSDVGSTNGGNETDTGYTNGTDQGNGKGSSKRGDTPRLLSTRQLKSVLKRSHKQLKRKEGGSGTERLWPRGPPAEPPDAWTFIHFASNQYALYMQEWMKHHMANTVRLKVNEMVPPLTPSRRRDDDDDQDGDVDEDEDELNS